MDGHLGFRLWRPSARVAGYTGMWPGVIYIVPFSSSFLVLKTDLPVRLLPVLIRNLTMLRFLTQIFIRNLIPATIVDPTGPLIHQAHTIDDWGRAPAATAISEAECALADADYYSAMSHCYLPPRSVPYRYCP